MQGMSERQYAAHAGVSRGAVQKARAAGRLVLFPDGSINARASDIRRAATTDPSKQRAASRLKPVPEAALGSVRETLKEQGLPAGGNVTFVQARTAHEIAKAHLARLTAHHAWRMGTAHRHAAAVRLSARAAVAARGRQRAVIEERPCPAEHRPDAERRRLYPSYRPFDRCRLHPRAAGHAQKALDIEATAARWAARVPSLIASHWR